MRLFLGLVGAAACCLMLGCSAGEDGGSTKDLANAAKIEPAAPSANTCNDGHTELTTMAADVKPENCQAVKTCQTSDEISAHVDLNGPSLLRGERPVPNINDRFCVHTVLDGAKNLKSGETLAPRRFVQNGLQVAIADVGASEQGGTWFDRAQVACAGLTLYGKTWQAPKSINVYSDSDEPEPKLSAESLGSYFIANRIQDDFWSQSYVLRSNTTAFYVSQSGDNNVGRASILGRYSVRCLAVEHG